MPLHDYSDTVVDHYENPRNVGEAAGANATATVESEACRDRLTLSLRIEGDVIREARFRAFGCVAAIAASSRTTELLHGLDLRSAAAISDAQVARELGGLPPAKVHCSVLARRAIWSALQDYDAAGRPTDSTAGPHGPEEIEGP